jgi:hypothetical protein
MLQQGEVVWLAAANAQEQVPCQKQLHQARCNCTVHWANLTDWPNLTQSICNNHAMQL